MSQYATLEEAQDYFGTRLHSASWDTFTPSDRNAALITATRQIDRLNFVGEKHLAFVHRQSLDDCITPEQEKEIAEAGLAQELQFPRGSDEVIPEDIKFACMEIAFELINGKDPQKELENLTIVSQGFSSVRNTQDRSFVHEHLNAGIVSAQAWRYLRPYLRDDHDFKISRVS